MLAASGLGLFGVYALVVLIATLVDVVRERVVDRAEKTALRWRPWNSSATTMTSGSASRVPS